MDHNFSVISLTPPEIAEGEASKITLMLQSGIIDFVHLRHPDADSSQLEEILKQIPEHLHSRIRIHSHFNLLRKYNLAGAHLNSRWPVCTVEQRGSLTKSCHSLKELWDIDDYEYVTLSPIYSNTSKPGNIGDFDRFQLCKSINGRRVIALGGVSPDKFAEINDAGFCGAGMLGYLWTGDMSKNLRYVLMFKHNNFGLQYVTNLDTPEGVKQEVKAVLDGGCRWIEVRMKEASDDIVAQTVELILPMCREVGAVIVIDDRVHLAAKLDVDGVHIGKEDMSPAEARAIIGDMKIIGSTANSFIDILKLNKAGIADYICLGPMRKTETKKMNAPTLGFEGFLDIFNELLDSQIDLPIVAVGGIKLKDAANLIDLGATGVAVNAAIRLSDDPTAVTHEFMKSVTQAQIHPKRDER